MATQNISTISDVKVWIEACSETENCEIETLKGDVTFIQSELEPTTDIEENSMVFLEFVPRQFVGNGTDKLWVYIDSENKIRKRDGASPVAVIADAAGNTVGVSENTLDVNVVEIHTNAVNQEFHQDTAITSDFASAVAKQSRSFDVVDATGFTIGDKIKIENGTVEPQFPTILDIATNTITIDRPLDRDYTTSDGIRKVNVNMAVDGSVTPQEFKIEAETSLTNALTHITRVIFEMTHNTAGDLGTFGGIAALTNGVVVRVYKGEFDFWKTITVWRTNADIKRDMYDVAFDARSGGQGDYGTSGRATFTRFGMIGEYDPTQGDFLELLIQDDLTGLLSFRMNAQGHTND